MALSATLAERKQQTLRATRVEQHAFVTVDPEELRRAAGDVRTAAEEIDESVAAHRHGLGVPGQRGWQSATNLDVAVQAWADHLRRLAARTEATSDDIEALADIFVVADRDAAGAWRAGRAA
jgi:uncharacterized protein YukE